MTATAVKVCGLTREEDALAAAALGAHALGFVFYPRSPRYVSPQQATSIARRLPPLDFSLAATLRARTNALEDLR